MNRIFSVMNGKYFWLLVLTTYIFIGSGCKSTKSSIGASQKELPNALLWQIDVPGASEPSYVFGTIHMIGAADYFLPEGTLGAIDKSKKMVFEIDIADMTDISKIMGMMGKLFMSDGQTLKDLLSDDDYKIVGDHFSKIGMPLMMLERIKPLFLSAMAYGDMDPSGFQSGSIKSYEMEFYDMAESKGMSTGGLETIEFQISVFDEIPYSEQAKMLVDAIKNTDSDNDEFKVMTDMYKAQDINKMVSAISAEDSGYSEYEDILLVKRNKSWIPQIIEGAKSNPTFYAVGAGHLGGENGVLKLLLKEGVKIKPLSLKK